MYGVDIVALHDIRYHIHHELLGIFIGRVEIFFVSISQKPLGMSFGNVIRRNGRFPNLKIGAIGIAPGMKLHSSFVRLFNHEF